MGGTQRAAVRCKPMPVGAQRVRREAVSRSPCVGAALARRFLAPLPRRLAHSGGVARAASRLARLFEPVDAAVLLTAAFVHDIGYGPELATSGFHPLDGARYLERTEIGARVASLVAHHSGARYEAAHRGCAARLARFNRERSLVADALTWCDLTTDPDGQPVTVDARLVEIRQRYPADSVVVRALEDAEPILRAACARVEAARTTDYRSRARAPSR